MAPNRATGRRPKRLKPRTKVAEVLKKQGRTYVWLANETGYSKTHVNAMANRRAPMAERFLMLAAQALNTTVKALR